MQSNRYAIFFLTHMTNDLAMNDICYKYSEDGVCLNSSDCVFAHTEVRCTNKNEIKDRLQDKNKKVTTR